MIGAEIELIRNPSGKAQNRISRKSPALRAGDFLKYLGFLARIGYQYDMGRDDIAQNVMETDVLARTAALIFGINSRAPS